MWLFSHAAPINHEVRFQAVVAGSLEERACDQKVTGSLLGSAGLNLGGGVFF